MSLIALFYSGLSCLDLFSLYLVNLRQYNLTNSGRLGDSV